MPDFFHLPKSGRSNPEVRYSQRPKTERSDFGERRKPIDPSVISFGFSVVRALAYLLNTKLDRFTIERVIKIIFLNIKLSSFGRCPKTEHSNDQPFGFRS